MQVVLFASCVFYMTSHDDFLERNIGDFLPLSQADRKVREAQIACSVGRTLSYVLQVDLWMHVSSVDSHVRLHRRLYQMKKVNTPCSFSLTLCSSLFKARYSSFSRQEDATKLNPRTLAQYLRE